ncbi:hypothetical protein TKK_0015328 [Trichogramma kaykai]
MISKIRHIRDDDSLKSFLQKFVDPQTEKKMIYFRHGYALEVNIWRELLLGSHKQSIFCKKLLHKFYNSSQLRRMCINPPAPDDINRRTVIPVKFLDMTCHYVLNDPETSIRRMVETLHISYHFIQRVLSRERLHAFHYRRVQGLQPEDYPTRLAFCQAMLRLIGEDPMLLQRILFTDESTFGRDGTFNMCNNHHYSRENPHVIIQNRHQTSLCHKQIGWDLGKRYYWSD